MLRHPWSPRPSFMTVTFVGALAVSSSGGILSELAFNKHAVADTLAVRADARVRQELLARGWTDPASGRLVELARELHRDTGVQLLVAERRFDLALSHGPITGKPPSSPVADRGAVVIRRELARYPRGFMRASGLRRVLFCADLQEEGRPIPSLPNYEGTLLIDVEANGEFMERLVHHEVFHFVDFAADEVLARDDEWERLNDRYFVYGTGGRHMRDGATSSMRGDLPGFVTAYSTSALEEDKAELFAFLMVAPVEVARIAARDAVLRAKTALLERRLGTRLPALRAAARAVLGRP